MAELNLKQITDKLNAEFTGEVRHLVFWYDADAEFVGDVDELELVNAKVLHLQKDNQFFTKHFLECVDTQTNYLVYAPFEKPALRDNHLADTIRYSKEFFADRASLLTLDLGMDERCKPIIQQYIKFFASKERTKRFYEMEVEVYNRVTIEIALMSVLCKSKCSSFEDVLRCVFSQGDLEDNKALAEFERYGLTDAFWKRCEENFGYVDVEPTLTKFAMVLFASYASKTIACELPTAWKNFESFKASSAVAFLDNLMNNFLYADCFDALSDSMYGALNGDTQLGKLPTEALTDCSLFKCIDKHILRWIAERLSDEDISAKLNGKTIPEICAARRKMHFGSFYRDEYFLMENACRIIEMGSYTPVSGLNTLVKQYVERDYQMDRRYCYFNFYLDKIEDREKYENLCAMVESIYTERYLSGSVTNWTQEYVACGGQSTLISQSDFFGKYIKGQKDRIVVIISDALRYEAGVSLFEKLQANEKCTATIDAMQTILPSVTRLGMAALLPHRKLSYSDDGSAFADDMPTDSMKQREAVLQTAIPGSRCIQFDDIKGASQAELRDIFNYQDVVYIYHNQIDARGDKYNTENEVFVACEEAIEEIFALIRRLTTNANRSRFIVTADHGFIYRRTKLNESDKICGSGDRNKRYMVASEDKSMDGVRSVKMGTFLEGDSRYLLFPAGTDVFKTSGGGCNYVHGGCSAQEMLVPVISVKTERSSVVTAPAQLSLISLTNKITNLITTLEFVQPEAVCDVVKEEKYHIFFEAADGERISNEQVINADKKDNETAKRMFRVRFTFKNKQYDRKDKYYLVLKNENGVETLRKEIMMDIAFANDFGF